MIPDLLNFEDSGIRKAKSTRVGLLAANITNNLEVLWRSWLQTVAGPTEITAAATRITGAVSAAAHFHQLPILILAKIVAVS